MADQRQENDKRSNDSLSSLRDYSKNLGTSAKALLDASKQFNKDSSMLAATFHGDTRGLISALNSFARSFGEKTDFEADSNKKTQSGFQEALGRFTTDFGEIAEDHVDAIDQSNNDLAKKLDKSGVKFDGYLKAFGKSIKLVLGYGIQKLETGFNSIVSDVESKFKDITVRQGYNLSQYQNMLSGFRDWVSNNGLKAQFSQIDLTNQLVPILQTGIRGPLAESMAEWNVITDKLTPYIQTNTLAYTRMSKYLGKTFSESTVELSKKIEATYGAESLEEGRAEELFQTVYRELLYTSTNQGWSAEQTNNVLNSLRTGYAQAWNVGDAYANSSLGLLKSIMSGEIGEGNVMGSLVAQQLGLKNVLDIPEALQSGADFFSAYSKALESLGADSSTANVLNKNLSGFNRDAWLDLMTYNNMSSDSKALFDQNKSGDATKTYQNHMEDLSKGMYQSITDQQTKWNENVASGLATLATSYVPDILGVLNVVKGIASAFFMAWLNRSSLNPVNPANPASAANPASVAGKALKFGTATRVLSGVGAGLMIAHDVGSTVAKTGDWSNALLAGVTGHTSMTSQEKSDATLAALNGQRREFSWSEMGKNALKGAGVGTAAGGGIWGTVIGAAVGGIGNAFHQWIENAKFNKLADASNAFSESLEKLKTASDNYTKVVNREKTVTEALEVIKNKESYSTEDVNTALEALKAQYPDYLSNVTDINQLDDEYIKLLREKVELERILAFKESAKAAKEASKDLNDKMWAARNLIGSDDSYSSEFYKIAEAFLSENNTDRSPERFNQIISEQYDSSFLKDSMSLEEYRSGLIDRFYNPLSDYNPFEVNRKGEITEVNQHNLGRAKKGAEKKAKEFDENLSSTYNSLVEQLGKDTNTLLESMLPIIVDIKSNNWTERDLIDKYTIGSVNDLKTALKEISNTIWGINEQADILSQEALSEFKFRKKSLSSYADLWDFFGMSRPQFKLGIGKVASDNLLANLHQGETVLPASAADDLRELSGTSSIGGISSFLSGLVGLSKVQVASTLPDTSSVDLVTNAIESQTRELSGILERIYSAISLIIPDTQKIRDSLSVASSIPSNLINYEI